MPKDFNLSANPYRRVALQRHENPDWIPVIVEGDSWFSFPGIAMRMNVIGHLQRTFDGRMAMLLMQHHGDHVTEILAGKQKRKLLYALKHRYRFRILLFSGGGNDIVDRMPQFLRAKKAGMTWRDCIIDENLDAAIEEIRESYQTLLAMRDTHNPDCHIFAHCYDFPTVNGKAVKIAGKKVSGPWLKPLMVARGIRNNDDQRNIVRHTLNRFRKVLESLPDTTPNPFTVVNTSGTLQERHWQDEIHPSTEGFGLIARRFGNQIVRHFPSALSKSKLRNYRP